MKYIYYNFFLISDCTLYTFNSNIGPKEGDKIENCVIRYICNQFSDIFHLRHGILFPEESEW